MFPICYRSRQRGSELVIAAMIGRGKRLHLQLGFAFAFGGVAAGVNRHEWGTTHMREAACEPITAWLVRWRAGESDALEQLMPLVYDELRRVARRQLSRESPANTLSATALVHEVYLRLIQQRQIEAEDRGSFLSIAAQTMRRILVDHARRRKRVKRGGDLQPVQLEADHDAPALLTASEVDEMLILDVALERLAALERRAAQIVEYRIFAGLTLEETASALGISVKTVQRTWAAARTWLRKEIAGERRLLH